MSNMDKMPIGLVEGWLVKAWRESSWLPRLGRPMNPLIESIRFNKGDTLTVIEPDGESQDHTIAAVISQEKLLVIRTQKPIDAEALYAADMEKVGKAMGQAMTDSLNRMIRNDLGYSPWRMKSGRSASCRNGRGRQSPDARRSRREPCQVFDGAQDDIHGL